MGGYGSQAFLGQEVGPNGPIRPVVMVFLPEEVVENSDLFERIIEETKVAVRIDHKNVIAVHGLARLDEGYARIVEYADGESLRAVVRRSTSFGRKIPTEIAVTCVADACLGVHYAHELGMSEASKPLIHGGIRPETLLIGFHGATKVSGYGAALIAEGLARARGAESSIRDAYTAPEQILGGRKAATVQTDVYALGAVLYEALSGKPPFGQDISLAEAITNSEPSQQLLADVPELLAKIVLRAMAKRAPDRFASPLEMREALLGACTPAPEAQVAVFMEEYFPADLTTQRQARQALLDAGKGAKLEDEAEEEFPDHDTQPNLKLKDAKKPGALTGFADGSRKPGAKAATASAKSTAAPPTSPRAPSQPPMAAPQPQAAPQTRGLAQPMSLPAAAPAAMLPSYSAEFQMSGAQPVVYRTHPAIYMGFGLLGGAVLLFGAIYFLRPQAIGLAMNQPDAAVAKPPVVADAAPAVVARPDAAVATPPPPPPPHHPADRPNKQKKPVKKYGTKLSNDGTISGEVDYQDPPPTASNDGTLAIDGPPGSEVFVDGRRMGAIPLDSITLKAGPHKVVVRQTGTGIEYRRAVTVKAGMDLTMTVQFHNE